MTEPVRAASKGLTVVRGSATAPPRAPPCPGSHPGTWLTCVAAPRSRHRNGGVYGRSGRRASERVQETPSAVARDRHRREGGSSGCDATTRQGATARTISFARRPLDADGSRPRIVYSNGSVGRGKSRSGAHRHREGLLERGSDPRARRRKDLRPWARATQYRVHGHDYLERS